MRRTPFQGASLLALCLAVATGQAAAQATDPRPNAPDASATSTYSPQSPGALTPEEEARRETEEYGLFGQRPRDSLFLDQAPATPTLRPARREEEQAEPDTAAASDAPAVPQPEPDLRLRAARIDADEDDRNARAELDNERVGAIETPSIEREPNPYAPLGLRVGTFTLTSTFEQGITASTNTENSPGGSGGALSESALRLNAASDWSRHAARIDAAGTFRRSLSGPDVSEIDGRVDGALDLDLAAGFRAGFTGGYAVRPESATSPVVIVGTTSRPLRHSLDGSASIGRDVGDLRLDLIGRVSRQAYGDADLVGGGTLSQKDRNSTLATVALRTGYQLSPAVTPFVEAEIGRRFTDLAVDSAGYARSADRLRLRGGVGFDLREKLAGEVSVGWIREKFDDARLEPLSGLDVAAALAWSPVRGTTVSLAAGTTVEASTAAGSSGSVLYDTSLSVAREIRANLTTTATLGAAWRTYSGAPDNELTLSAQAGATWWFNRHAGLTGRLRHERFKSTLPGRDSQSSSAFLGVTLQR